MSIAYQCDRCGKLVAIDDDKQKIHMIVVNYRDVYGCENRHYEEMTRLDICEECNNSLIKWLGTKGDHDGRDVRTGASKKGARDQRRKTRDNDKGDTPSEG